MRLVLWFGLAGCASREVSLFEEPPPSGEVWAPQEEPEDTVIDPGDLDGWGGNVCAERPTKGEPVEVSWCARLTPEGDETRPGDLTGGLDTGAPPPPCGFYNMLGAVNVSESAVSPLSVYCDSDENGGLRSVRYVPGEETVSGRMLRAGGCRSNALSGALLPLSEAEALVWWLVDGDVFYLDEDTSVMGVRIDADGAMLSEPLVLAVSAIRLGAVRTTLTSLLLGVTGETLWAAPTRALDADLSGSPLPLRDGVDIFRGTAFQDGAVLGLCMAQTRATELLWVSEVGAWERSLPWDSTCAPNTVPSLAAMGDQLAVAWEDRAHMGHLHLRDADGALQVAVDLGTGARAPVVFAGDGIWWTLDATGWLRAWSTDGAPLGQWSFPHLPEDPYALMGLQARTDDDRLLVQVWSQELEFINDHAYTFDYLEVSVGWLPSP